MTDNDKQAHIRQRLQEMGVMQPGADTKASPATRHAQPPADNRGFFAGLVPLMLISALLSAIFIYWLIAKSSDRKERSETNISLETLAPARPSEPASSPASASIEPKPADTPATATTTAAMGSAEQQPVEQPATGQGQGSTSTQYRPAYPYPPAPYQPYARPLYPPYYMPPPPYRYPAPLPPPQR